MIYIYIYIHLAEFLNTYLKTDQNIRTEKTWGLAILVGLIVMLMGWEGASMSIRGGGGGEGDAKAWYCPLVLLFESQCARHVCL